MRDNDWFVRDVDRKEIGAIDGTLRVTVADVTTGPVDGEVIESFVGLALSNVGFIVKADDEFVRDVGDVDGKRVGAVDGWLNEAFGGDGVSVINGKFAGYSVNSVVGNWLHVVSNVVDIVIGSSVIILWHVSSVWSLLHDSDFVSIHSSFPLNPISTISQ